MVHIIEYHLFLNEQAQVKRELDPKQLPQKSDRLGKGGSFETSLYGNVTKDEYFKILKAKDPKAIKRVRLVFPSSDWEVLALKLIKTLGVITGVFTDITTAIKFINGLVSKGVTVDELVIGSHGTVGTLLIPKQGARYAFDNSFLTSFKPLVHQGTKVFFTACHGADYLDTLKDASEKLGVKVYGSAGIYNYVTNSSEKGFYMCYPNKFETKKDWVLEPVQYRGKDDTMIITWKEENGGVTGDRVKITLDQSLFGVQVDPIILFTSPVQAATSSTSSVRESFEVMHIEFKLLRAIEMNSAIDRKYTDPTYYPKFTAKLNQMPGKDKWEKSTALSRYLFTQYTNGMVKIEITNGGQWKDIKSLPKITFNKSIDNKYLLNNGLCKRYDNPPVSWLD